MKFKNEKERNKMKQIIQSKKVITIVVVSLLATVTLYSAAPAALVAAASWIRGTGSVAGYAWSIVSGVGTVVTYGQLYNEIFAPQNKESKIAARPTLETYASKSFSGVYSGTAWGGYNPIYEDSPEFSYGYLGGWDTGNYSITEFDYQWVEWNSEDQEYSVNPDRTMYVKLPMWVSDWQSIVASDDAAQMNDWWTRLNGGDTWSKPGFWIRQAKSIIHEYPEVKLESRVFNPSTSESVVDGELLQDAADNGYDYSATVSFQRQGLVWVWDRTGIYGSWQGKTPWIQDSDTWPNVPGYEYASTSMNICDPHERVRSERIQGGIDIWWHENYEEVRAHIMMVPIEYLDANGNITDASKVESIEENDIQQNIEWVSRFTRL
jgi:hypothetical protein